MKVDLLKKVKTEIDIENMADVFIEDGYFDSFLTQYLIIEGECDNYFDVQEGITEIDLMNIQKAFIKALYNNWC